MIHSQVFSDIHLCGLASWTRLAASGASEGEICHCLWVLRCYSLSLLSVHIPLLGCRVNCIISCLCCHAFLIMMDYIFSEIVKFSSPKLFLIRHFINTTNNQYSQICRDAEDNFLKGTEYLIEKCIQI